MSVNDVMGIPSQANWMAGYAGQVGFEGAGLFSENSSRVRSRQDDVAATSAGPSVCRAWSTSAAAPACPACSIS